MWRYAAFSFVIFDSKWRVWSSFHLSLVWATPAWMCVCVCVLFQAPLWAYLLCAVGLFIYQSLDAIDGKQARRTNSSSPLGELFDHGCDSLSTGQFIPVCCSVAQWICQPLLTLTVSCVCPCSVCGVGNQYSSPDGNQSGLDVLLLLRRDVYVLLCPLANIRVRNAALWHVSRLQTACFYCFWKATWSFSAVCKVLPSQEEQLIPYQVWVFIF